MCFTGRVIMVLEEQRFIHEDLERLEQAIADRVVDEPRNVSLSAFRDWRFLICFVCVCVCRSGNDCLAITRSRISLHVSKSNRNVCLMYTKKTKRAKRRSRPSQLGNSSMNSTSSSMRLRTFTSDIRMSRSRTWSGLTSAASPGKVNLLG